MKKNPQSRTPLHRRSFLLGALFVIAAIAALDAFGLQRPPDSHAAASSYIVCHAVAKDPAGGEQYFCSQQGCFSDADEVVTVVGSYEDPATCSGIADTLQEGGEEAR